ncbi:MAG TPA: DUF2071 domain-containing protein, partial [Candidatus Didemnitutus sp.]|nr:DUF2071 domain-containing protein [Candidatus Didemnitutus sp.]
MNTLAPILPAPAPGATAATARQLPWRETRFIADWRRMLFVHFSLPPEALAPHVPFELDLHDGAAFVSLVFFTLERMRPPGTGAFGRLLLRAISDHPFLNVRTYVRHGDRTGIQFLAEWIPNRLSLVLGPLTYGLPYRLGDFDYRAANDGGVAHLNVTGRNEATALNLTYPERFDGEFLP